MLCISPVIELRARLRASQCRILGIFPRNKSMGGPYLARFSRDMGYANLDVVCW
jgi:hypothetical protein